MKKLSVSTRMILCFVIVILLTAIIGIVSILGMNALSSATSTLYHKVYLSMENVGRVRENFQEQRTLIQALYVGPPEGTGDGITAQIETNLLEMRGYIDQYIGVVRAIADTPNQTLLTEDNLKAINTLYDHYNDFFEPELIRLLGSADSPDMARLSAFINAEQVTSMLSTMETGYDLYATLSANSTQAAENLYTLLRRIIIVGAFVLIMTALISLFYLPGSIARPLKHMVRVADAMATGDMDMAIEYRDRGDEVGRLACSFERMRAEMTKQIDIMDAIAHADLTVEPTLRSENDTLGNALVELSQNLDRIITDVTQASDLVSEEARMVAEESQELAQGTTEQAASVEQLSSAFFEISLNTKESANMAVKAAEVSDDVKRMAVEGERLMAQLIQAVADTHTASQSIDKIIKDIEEISMKTNILALNAAVEAAHAGQHGSGFAVVASEVRSLANRSASSSKETSELIANMLEKVRMGAKIADQTSAAFQQIVQGVIESTKLVTDIAKSSEEQAIAIEQINTGISQVAQVIHVNSEAAEKCATSAEKMHEQSRALEDAVSMFKTKSGSPIMRGLKARTTAKEKPLTIDLSPTIPADNFGKY